MDHPLALSDAPMELLRAVLEQSSTDPDDLEIVFTIERRSGRTQKIQVLLGEIRREYQRRVN